MPGTCCWRPRSGDCSSPASTRVGGSRCTAWCVKCCWPSWRDARPNDCASSTPARPAGSRAWATGMSAIEHWLEAGEPAEALRLLAALSMSRFDDGGAGGDRPDPAADPAGGHGRERRLARADRLVPSAGRPDQLPRRARGRGDRRRRWGDPEETGRLDILRSLSAWLAGDWQACIDHALAGLEQLGGGALSDPIGRFGWSLVSHGMALQERWSDDGRTVEEARRPLPTTATAGSPTREPARWAWHWPGSRSTRCASQPACGTWRKPPRCGRCARSSTSPRRWRHVSSETATAPSTLWRQLAARSAYPCTYVRVLAQLELVELRLSDGDVADAGSLFREAEELVGRELNGPGGRGWLARVGVLVCPERAESHRRRAVVASDRRRASGDRSARPGCTSPRGGTRTPREAVRRAEPRCARHEVVRGLLLARAVADVDHQEAAKSVEIAVERAAEHGMLQTVAADGGAVLELLELAAWRVPSAWMNRLRRTLTPDRACRVGLQGSSRS